jgi:hypothetical protein
MSLLAGLVRAALPVGSARRDKLLGAARSAGVLPIAPESSYQRWQRSLEAEHTSAFAFDDQLVLQAEKSVQFEITIDDDGRTDPLSVTRTLVSLANQTFGNWVARLPSHDGYGHAAKRLLVDAQLADPRFNKTRLAEADTKIVFSVHIRFGDSLSATALMELAMLAVQHPTAHELTGEFDMIDPFSGLRSAPAAVGQWESDLAQQFDLHAGFVATKQSPVTLDASEFVPHAPNVLLHRLVGPQERMNTLLPPQHVTSPGVVAQRSPHRHGGLRIRHDPGVMNQVSLVIRDPLGDPLQAARHAKDLVAFAGAQVQVAEVVQWRTGTTFPAFAEESDAVAIIDGGVVPLEKGWLDDLLGALHRPHVLVVAPVLLVPSGIVFDGGVSGDGINPFRARSGRLDLAPYELARCRRVTSLSGRALVIRTSDLNATPSLVDALSTGTFTEALHAFALSSQRCCLIWAHQRWTLSAGLNAEPTDSPMLAWNRGRLLHWWESKVTPHQPEPGRQGEGVW